MSETLAQFLATVPVLADAHFEPGELEDLARSFVLQRHRPGERIFAQGAPADAFYVVVSGRVLLTCEREGERLLLAELGPGEPVGELAAIDGGTQTAEATAEGEVELAALPDAVFDRAMEAHPRLALAFLRMTSRRLRQMTERVALRLDSEPEQEPVETAFPYPIASVARNLRVLAEPGPRLERLFDLLEVLVRTLGAVAVACLRASGRPVPMVDEHLARGLVKMTLGAWLGLIRELAEAFHDDRERLFVPELVSFVYETPGRRAAGFVALEELIRFRNELRHGAGGALSEARAAEHLARQTPLLQGVLHALGFLADYPLLHLDRMDFRGGRFVYRAQRCMGSHGDFPTEELVHALPLETGRAVLLHRDGEQLLPLYPMVAIGAGEGGRGYRQVMLLTGADRAAVSYVEFLHGRTHLDPEALAALDLLRAEARERLRQAEHKAEQKA
jgi:CRP-like cAMP-binding protein